MSKLSGLADNSERMRTAPPAAFTLTSAVPGDVRGVLLLDGPLGKSGTPVRVKQESGVYGLTLDEIVKGGMRGEREIHPSGPGDVLVFENGFIEGDLLTVGKLATRLHEGMTGPVQVARLLARPSKSSVSKRGAIQFATLIDPSVATVVRTRDAFAAFCHEQLGKEWPGGSFGLVLRDRTECIDIMRDDDGRRPETLDGFIARMLDVNKLMDDGKPLELMPVWSLPMGQEQVMRDGDVRTERQASVGRFGNLYGSHRPALQPSLVIIGDEEEWAFNDKTGNIRRVVLGMHPLRTDFNMHFHTIPSRARGNEPVSPVKWLYKDAADMQRSVADRQRRAAARVQARSEMEQRIKSLAGGSLRRFGGR